MRTVPKHNLIKSILASGPKTRHEIESEIAAAILGRVNGEVTPAVQRCVQAMAKQSLQDAFSRRLVLPFMTEHETRYRWAAPRVKR